MLKSDVRKIAELFSNGQFDEIINTYFKKMQTNKSEKINIQTIQQFFGDENINNSLEHSPNNNNKDNDNENFSNSNNNLYSVSPKNDNFNSDFDENTINKTLTFQGIGESLVDFDFILNTPPSTKKNNLYNEEKIHLLALQIIIIIQILRKKYMIILY